MGAIVWNNTLKSGKNDIGFRRCFARSVHSLIAQYVIFAVWIGFVLGCFFWLGTYSNKAEMLGAAPLEIEKSDQGNHRLYFFVHPQCPCTVASSRQLHRTLGQMKNSVQTDVKAFVFVPEGKPDSWFNCNSVSEFELIECSSWIKDVNGQIARQFGAKASGTILIYSPQGRLLFQGGITTQRGHEGESAASLAIANILAGGKANINKAPVFGCQIYSN